MSWPPPAQPAWSIFIVAFFIACLRLLAIKNRNSFNFDHSPYIYIKCYVNCAIFWHATVAETMRYVYDFAEPFNWQRFCWSTVKLLNALWRPKWIDRSFRMNRSRMFTQIKCDVISNMYRSKKVGTQMFRPVFPFSFNWVREMLSKYISILIRELLTKKVNELELTQNIELINVWKKYFNVFTTANHSVHPWFVYLGFYGFCRKLFVS